MKRIAILGSTGSIGTQSIAVAREHRDRIEVVGLAAHSNAARLDEQARELDVPHVCLVRSAPAGTVPTERGAFDGAPGLLRLIEECGCDLLLNAISGGAGLAATARALELGIDVALANKESLVMAGELLVRSAERSGARLIPVDSEHSALAQLLATRDRDEVRRLHLTASGGPFRGRSRGDLGGVTPAEALRHPTWTMGSKITVDSATLMNKALEMIEAQHLFGRALEEIDVVIHPQSVVHGLVELTDGSFLAHLGPADMRIPIRWALSCPERWPGSPRPIPLPAFGALDFEAPDHETFPSLRMAREAGASGGTAPAVLNAANEAAVALFLERRLPFLGIFDLVRRALDDHRPSPIMSLDQVFRVDHETREKITAWTSPSY